MKKIAIMTWIHYPNYGSILQAFALKTFLTNLGYDVSFVNYQPKKQFSIDLNTKKYNSKKMKEFIKNRITTKNLDLISRQNVFNKFINENLKITQKCETDSQLYKLNEEFDYFICGSDQIWSPLVFDKKYFLSFVDSTDKMIAYAPSMGGSNINDTNIYEEMRVLISRFTHISIREQQGKEIIKDMIKKDVPVVCDPTMLLNKEQWSNYATKRVNNKKYIVAYFLGDSKFYWKYLDELRSKEYEIIIIPTKHYHYNKKYKTIENLSPNEFLGLIKNAEAVCTDSYHGTIFAQIFEVPFLTLQRFKNNDYNEQNSRIITLLNDTDNINRLVECYDKEKTKLLFEKANFNKKFEVKINDSKSYLNNALSVKLESISNEYKISETCSGCGVCNISCPTDAIDIKLNKNGFYKAYIDKEKCIECGICKSVCGFNSELCNFDKNLKIIAARVKDKDVLSNTTSGGLGYSLTKLLLEKKYDVVGCKYDTTSNKAMHVYIKGMNDNMALEKIKQLSGSKYLQSYTVDAFQRLKDSEKAIVIGTPCQIASLSNYLTIKKIRDNFVLIDLICHGVPSYNLWEKYLTHLKDEYNIDQVKNIKFRKKLSDNNNNNMNLFIEGNNRSIVTKQENDFFYRSFCVGNCYDESCYECNFRISSLADIRLGDYWGEKYKNKNGTSMVICCTKKGEELINEISDEAIQCYNGEFEDYMNHQQTFNLNPPFYYNQLMKDLKNNNISMKEFDKKYCYKHYSIKKAKNIIKVIIRRK